MKFIHSIGGRAALFFGIAVGLLVPATGWGKPPLKALLIAGGGYHDYAKLVPYIVSNMDNYINIHIDVRTNLDSLKRDKFADGYEVVIYDVCWDNADSVLLENAMKVGQAGKATVMIHCSVHAFRHSDKVHLWEEFCGMRSKVHDPYEGFSTEKLDPASPITKFWPDDWKTPGDELYQTIEFLPGSHALLRAKSPHDGREHIVCWTHMYGKGRVFATTLGHDFKTLQSPQYMQLLANGILWSCDRLAEDGKPKRGSRPEPQ